QRTECAKIAGRAGGKLAATGAEERRARRPGEEAGSGHGEARAVGSVRRTPWHHGVEFAVVAHERQGPEGRALGRRQGRRFRSPGQQGHEFAARRQGKCTEVPPGRSKQGDYWRGAGRPGWSAERAKGRTRPEGTAQGKMQPVQSPLD